MSWSAWLSRHGGPRGIAPRDEGPRQSIPLMARARPLKSEASRNTSQALWGQSR
jgi:hypothetical protein